MEEREPATPPVREFPAVERLIRLYMWMAAFGAVFLLSGLALGFVAGQWAAASALLPAGVLALVVGLWARRRGLRALEYLRKK